MQPIRIRVPQGVGVGVLVEVEGEGDGVLHELVPVGGEEAGGGCVVVAIDEIVVAGFGVELTRQPTQRLGNAFAAGVTEFAEGRVREGGELWIVAGGRIQKSTDTVLVIRQDGAGGGVGVKRRSRRTADGRSGKRRLGDESRSVGVFGNAAGVVGVGFQEVGSVPGVVGQGSVQVFADAFAVEAVGVGSFNVGVLRGRVRVRNDGYQVSEWVVAV